VSFWRIHRLKRDLAARDLPPREVLAYVLTYVLLMNLGSLREFFPDEKTPFTLSFTWREAAFLLASLVISAIGLYSAYRANGGDQGRDLAGRLLSLSWVLGLRVGALLVPVFVMFMVAVVIVGMGPTKEEIPESFLSVLFGFFLLIGIFYYWRLAHHLRDVSRTIHEQPAESF
jgi:hypothetical protein